MQFTFPVTVTNASAGDIQVQIDAPDTGINGGIFTIGRIAGKSIYSHRSQRPKLYNWVLPNAEAGMFRVQEDVTGTFVAGDNIELVLADGYTWNPVGGGGTATKVAASGATVVAAVPYTNSSGLDELDLTITPTAGRITVTVTPFVNVADDATLGDFTVDVGGAASSATVTIGTVADFGVTVTGADALTVTAGGIEQKIAPVTLKEGVKGSILGGRNISLKLPSYAKWDKNPTIEYVKGDNALLTAVNAGTATQDGARHELKYTVKAAGSASATEVKLKDAKIYVSADAPEGDVKITITGSAGVTGEVVVAKIQSPVTATASAVTEGKIGLRDQVAGDLTIAEKDKGVLLATPNTIDVANTDGAALTKTGGVDGFVTITTPAGVSFTAKPTITVTAGNLKLKTEDISLNTNSTKLDIPIDKASTTASTIKISGIKLDINRTVPEGTVDLAVTGTSLDKVSTVNDVAVASVSVLDVKTPAPGDTSGVAVFKIGDASYTLNGAKAALDAAPYIKDGRTMLPVRAIANAVGVADANIIWDPAGKVTVIKGDRVVQLTIGSKAMLVNGAAITIEVSPEITAGRTFLPAACRGASA